MKPLLLLLVAKPQRVRLFDYLMDGYQRRVLPLLDKKLTDHVDNNSTHRVEVKVFFSLYELLDMVSEHKNVGHF